MAAGFFRHCGRSKGSFAYFVIASAAKQSMLREKLDCFVASAPRNDADA
jgi:hypothetical protein